MKRLAALVLIPFTLNGCASIVSDSTYPVTIRSAEGARVTVLDEKNRVRFQGEGPTSMVTLSAKDGFFDAAEYTIEAKHECGPVAIAPLHARLDGWYIGNILFGGLIGFLLIDPATGAMWKLDEFASVRPTKQECEAVEPSESGTGWLRRFFAERSERPRWISP